VNHFKSAKHLNSFVSHCIMVKILCRPGCTDEAEVSKSIHEGDGEG
jgi:hypothetical protein